MEFNNFTRNCENCSVGFYKNVSGNETDQSVKDRFWCKRCPANRTTFTGGSTNLSDCIGNKSFIKFSCFTTQYFVSCFSRKV